MLGIIGAMKAEVAQLKQEMNQPEVVTVAGMEFYRGTIGEKEVVVVQSGIGKVSAALCVQILADRFGVDGVVNTGIAGSTDAIQHDVDATNFGYPLGEIPQLGTLTFEADERLRSLAKKCCEEVNPDISVYEGRILTGDQFICDKNKKEWLSKTFNGSCTEMEGAAIAQAAYLNKIPFLIVRAISDKADDSASMDYPEFERQAIIHSTNLTRALILAY